MEFVKTWLKESIFATVLNAILGLLWVFPCIIGVPMGVMGIVKAYEAERQLKLHKESIANIYAKSARKWTIWSFFIALLGLIFAISVLLLLKMFGFVLLQAH
jgi:hypothetical protein